MFSALLNKTEYTRQEPDDNASLTDNKHKRDREGARTEVRHLKLTFEVAAKNPPDRVSPDVLEPKVASSPSWLETTNSSLASG